MLHNRNFTWFAMEAITINIKYGLVAKVTIINETSACLIGVEQHTGRSVCVNCGRVKPTQAVEDGHRDIIHGSSYVSITM
jgi:hypothetical protein